MDKDNLIACITAIIVVFIIMFGFIYCCQSIQKRNIEKELQLKQMEITLKEIEVYGEKRGVNE